MARKINYAFNDKKVPEALEAIAGTFPEATECKVTKADGSVSYVQPWGKPLSMDPTKKE